MAAGRYNPGMRDARRLASLAAVGRALRWKPRTYPQAWLFAAFVGTLPSLVVFCILGASNGWRQPWLALVTVGSAVQLVIQGLAQSYDVHRRRTGGRVSATN